MKRANYNSKLAQYQCLQGISKTMNSLIKPELTGSKGNRALGTIINYPTEPLTLTSNTVLLIPNYVTQPLVTTKISTTSEIRVFLRYRSLKANTALKSPKYGRTLKPVATAAISTVFSVNPLSRTNCRIRRTFMPRPAKKSGNEEHNSINHTL